MSNYQEYASKQYVDEKVADSGGGGNIVTDEQIAEAVGKYMTENPPESREESDPTVHEWAKQPNKPSYTAAEVGALPSDTVIPVVPNALPNPKKLTFTGAVSAEYDGSKAVEVNIPAGGVSGDYIPTPSTAEVGQTIVVKAVDDTGKPTEWEMAKLPKAELIAYINSTEATNIKITTDLNGNPFELTDAELQIYLPMKTERASYRFSYCIGGTPWQYLTIADNQLWRVNAEANAITHTVKGTAYRYGNTVNNTAFAAVDMPSEYSAVKIDSLEISGLETGATIIFAGTRC